jgi:pimeloyl-ACP methyl ester carboxylesterase
MATVTVNGIALYYEEHGAGAPILGIHGTPSSAVLWEDAARELAGVGRCVIYDRRGFHRSERPAPFDSVDLADHVDDAAALLDALSAKPAAVIGRSTGGQIALALAHRFPDAVSALVLLEPALFSIDPSAAAWAADLRRRVLHAAAEGPASAGEVAVREALGDTMWGSLPEELKALFVAASPAVVAETRGRGLDLSAEPLDLSAEELAAIGQPTLLVSAQDSPEALRRVNDGLASALPRAEHAIVGGGHLINPAHPAILDFLGRVLA